jgi:hypothetical protein
MIACHLRYNAQWHETPWFSWQGLLTSDEHKDQECAVCLDDFEDANKGPSTCCAAAAMCSAWTASQPSLEAPTATPSVTELL